MLRFTLLLGLCICPAVHAQYHFVDLGIIDGGMTDAKAVNNHGHVVGWNVDLEAVLYDGTNMIPLGTLTGIYSMGHGINDANQIVGQYSYIDGSHGVQYGAFIYESEMADLGTLGGAEAFAYDINEAGIICGWSEIETHQRRAFIYDGIMHNLGCLPGGWVSYGYGINDDGKIVGMSGSSSGNHAFLYENDTMYDLGTLGGQHSVARAINNAGEIVGDSQMPSAIYSHAFVIRDGEMIDLGTLGAYTVDSHAWDINDAGVIVGDSIDGLGYTRAFVVGQDGVMRMLNSLAPSYLNYDYAYGINDAGWIVGRGALSVGTVRAYLLIPYSTPRGDIDGDGELGLDDFGQFTDCVSDPQGDPLPSEPGVTPAHCISAFDRDFDGDIDLYDFGGLQIGLGQ
jgi:probable HAF family extracellular repeat protein